MNRYWEECLVYKNDHVIDGYIGNDGLLLKFEKEDVTFLLVQYPMFGGCWWFNSIHDRIIAEQSGTEIIANPQIVWRAGYQIVS